MPEFKIYVYAISKNESKFAARWYASMSEADGVYVLDTGSDDDTVDILRSLGAHVETRIITPWRFDTARNLSLELVPDDADLCVCTDLDEVFHPCWRAQMEKALCLGAKRLRYRYTWNFLPDGREGYVFWIEKAHARHGFRWVNPVHEVLQCDTPCVTVSVDGVQCDHHADESKSRGQYLELLELAVREEPDNDRNMHYLGREYMFYGRWADCERTLTEHLSMPSAVWRDERAASMRYIARAVKAQGRRDDAMSWLLRAIAEAPHLREPWLEASQLALENEEWSGALYFAQKALAISVRPQTYINEAQSWGAKPYDIAALAAYYLGLYPLAADYGKKALEIEPDNERLINNMEFYEKALA